MKLLKTAVITLLTGLTVFAEPVVVCNYQDAVSVSYLAYRKTELEQILRQLNLMCTLHSNSHLLRARDEVKALLNEINKK